VEAESEKTEESEAILKAGPAPKATLPKTEE
jgi:hypothetical protein